MILPRQKFRVFGARTTDGKHSKDSPGIIGSWIHAITVRETDKVIKSLFYAGEKTPHMWWAEIKGRFIYSFSVYVKREGCIVHSDSVKIGCSWTKSRLIF